jgi:hypothetical protein
LRAQRGNCGVSDFKKGLPYLEHDEAGPYVMGYRVAPNCDGETYGDIKIRRCPVAGANLVSNIVSDYWVHKKGLYSLEHTHPNPSIAFLDAISYYETTYSIYEARVQKQTIEEFKNGNNTKQNRN